MNSKTVDAAKAANLTERTLHLAKSDGGVKNTALEAWDVSFTELCERFMNRPPVHEKDGSYFVRGPFVEGAPVRGDANIAHSSLVVVDCDSRYDPATGSVSEGAPDPQRVHDVLVKEDLSHLLYTTHSHGQAHKGNRYRVLIPLESKDAEEMKGVLNWIFRRLAAEEVYLVNVKENTAWSQPWYFPRLAKEDSEYVCLHHEGHRIPEIEADAEETREPLTLDAVDAQVTEAPPRDSDSIPARYNEAHGQPEQMVSYLQEKGYTLAQVGRENDAPSYRLLCPGSTTGTAGVVLFRCSDGIWRAYSHHGSDPLNENDGQTRAKDAFDLFRILDHKGDGTLACAAYARELDPRPLIRIQAGTIPQVFSTVVSELALRHPPPVYQRGMQLVRVAHSGEEVTDDGIHLPSGTASILPLRHSNLLVTLSEQFRWEKYSKKQGWHPADPPANIISALLDGYGMWGGIPPLKGLSECPLLQKHGSLLSTPGYDPASQLYVEGRVAPITLPEQVSKEEALAALSVLMEPFEEFPFVDESLDRAVVLAYLFTLAVRAVLPTAPMFAVSATTPGTGKGLLVEIANIIVRGRDAALMPPVQGRDSEEEMRKRITSFVSQGFTSINLDNYSRPIGGDSLNALLTTTEWTDRQLGTNNTIRVPVCCTLAATGNNLTVRGDMTRRTLLTQLDAGVEHPERRTFKQKDLVGHVRKNRSKLLTALFTILKGYQQSGCTAFDDERLGRFERWSEMVCHPIQWLELPSPALSQERLRQSDPEAENLAALLTTWHDVHKSAWVTASSLANTPDGNQHSNGIGTTKDYALHDALIDVAGKNRRIENRLLGWYLSRNEGRIADGLRLERKDRRGLQGKHAHEYRVVRAGVDMALPPEGTNGNNH
ncbi:hypothetical protein E2F43_18265 [Seongchinamella unica]|uniref:Uncharacterized protein n=1 Tax=Seongchinamella unica TaxID=2547392 RepID=A0A4R5LN70_9GAMM|nr:hypothetical protein [Seongchinamella unica]TDG11656.1 hypothetical protein E2F43_18265 [Seongchinamella unica]